jgi:large subunit ribosomal protein L6
MMTKKEVVFKTSRIAKRPVIIPAGINVTIRDQQILIKGPKGQLTYEVPAILKIEYDKNQFKFSPVRIHKKQVNFLRALIGTTTVNLKNNIEGVQKGYAKTLSLVGIGNRAQAQGKKLQLSLGFSHPVIFAIPEGVTIDVNNQTELVIKGIDKQLVGQVAANIRELRTPNPYKGTGIRYKDEVVILKEIKKK